MGDIRPIGLFDSGIGGLTVAKEVFRLLPNESVIYFGDTARLPYGSRKTEELIDFAGEIVSFLIALNVKYIVFACGTNSSLTLPVMRALYNVPMIGLIEPGAREAVKLSHGRRIGVIATEATIKSGAYQRAIKLSSPELEIYVQAAPGLVPLVEAGLSGSKEARQAVFESARVLKEMRIDTLILGCTHYPFLYAHFREYFGPDVKIVDPATATVLNARLELEQQGMLNKVSRPVQHNYYVSGDPKKFRVTAQQLGFDILPIQYMLQKKSLLPVES